MVFPTQLNMSGHDPDNYGVHVLNGFGSVTGKPERARVFAHQEVGAQHAESTNPPSISFLQVGRQTIVLIVCTRGTCV